jgi:hypothetical protein
MNEKKVPQLFVQTGAPRSMKMGTARSPSRYDAEAFNAL